MQTRVHKAEMIVLGNTGNSFWMKETEQATVVQGPFQTCDEIIA